MKTHRRLKFLRLSIAMLLLAPFVLSTAAVAKPEAGTISEAHAAAWQGALLSAPLEAEEKPTLLPPPGQAPGDEIEAVATLPEPLPATTPAPPGELPPDSGEATSAGWVTIMTEDFEGPFPGTQWTLRGNPSWGREQYRKHSGARSGYCAGSGSNSVNPPGPYPDDMDSWMIYGPFDLSNATDAELEFYYWAKTEEDFDYFRFRASIDGQYFTGYKTSGDRVDDCGGWCPRTFDLTNVPNLGNLCGQKEVWIAFVFDSDPSRALEGAYVDDITLRKEVSSQPPPSGDCVCESSHPYGDYEYGEACSPLVNPDPYASCTRVHFSRIELGEGAHIYLKQANGQVAETIWGPIQATDWWSPCIPGTTVKVELWTGSYEPAWGFCIDQVGEEPGPVCPDAPVLNTINNSVCDGTYQVEWQEPSGAIQGTTEYVLQEDDNPSLSSPSAFPAQTTRSRQISGKAPGTYYYQVKAVNPDCESGWSNVREVTVCAPEDHTPPTIENVRESDDPINKDGCGTPTVVTISADVYDDQSGVDRVELHYQGPGEAWASKLMSSDYGGTYSGSLGPFQYAGTLRYYIRAFDNAGNDRYSVTYTVTVNDCAPADTTPPSIYNIRESDDPINRDGCGTPTRVTISASIIDDQSGLDWVTLHYQPPGGSWTSTAMPYTQNGSYSASATIGPFANAGALRYYIEASDNADNVGETVQHTVTVEECALPAPTLYPIDNTDCDNAYEVSWSPVSGATYYVLQEADNPQFSSPRNLPQTTENVYWIGGRDAGTYYYQVKACNAAVCSDWSNAESAQVYPGNLAAPQLHEIPNPECDCDFWVSWTEVEGAEGYELKGADNPSFDGATSLWPPGTSVHASGDCQGQFYYKIRAYNCRTESAWSNTRSVYVLGAPDLNSIDNEDCDGAYQVSWSDVPGATAYELQEDDNPSFSSPVRVREIGDTWKDISGKSPGVYYYQVRATSPTCDGPWSNAEWVKVWPFPSKPDLYRIDNDDCDGDYDVSWSEVEDATWYELQEDDNPFFWFPETVYDDPATLFRVRDQDEGTYYYQVKACNCRGCSDWSGMRSTSVLGVPTLLPILNTDCDDTFQLTWTPVDGAAGYEVWEDSDPWFPDKATVHRDSATSKRISDRQAGTYYYKVRAYTEWCSGPWSNVQSVKVWPVPDAPWLDSIDNEDGDGDYDISWSEVDDATWYELQEDDRSWFPSSETVYQEGGTDHSVTDQDGGTWYYQARGCNCRTCGPWSNTQPVFVPEPASVLGVEASIDGIPNEIIGCFISLPGQGIPVWNTFTAHVRQGGNSVSKVEFTLDGETKTDYSAPNGWTAVYDMSELPPGNAVLTVVAYDSVGRPSDPLSALIYTIAAPPWHGKPWVLLPQAVWSPGEGKYYFQGRVPSNPRLYYEYDLQLPYLGSLHNAFESDVVVTEVFNINGLWAYQALGVLRAELLNYPVTDKSYAAQPLLRPGAPAWHSLDSYQWQKTWEVAGVTTPLVRDMMLGVWFIGPIEVDLRLNLDFGFDGSLTIQGRLHSDLTPDQIRIVPGLSPYVRVDLQANALWGVARVGAEAFPTIHFYMPVVYDLTPPPGSGPIYLDSPCVVFELKAGLYGSLFWDFFGLGRLHTRTITLAEVEWPDGCAPDGGKLVSVALSESSRVDVFAAPDIASDGEGGALAVWIADADPSPAELDPEVFYAHWDGTRWGASQQLTANERFETDPRVAFFPSGQAVAVWTQNEMSRSDPDEQTDLNDVLAQQELYYSLWDGNAWSQPGRITHDSVPDGLAAIATGPEGEALAVWIRDPDGRVETRNDWTVYSSRWDGETWSAPVPVAVDNAASATEPTVAYYDAGKALVVWSHDADADLLTVEDCHLAYAAWDDTGWSAPVVLDEWPAGAHGPELAFGAGEEPVLAFTVREKDVEGQYYGDGLHDLLWSARYHDGSWQLAAIGENTVGAEPRLFVNPSNYATVAFRGFRGEDSEGYGGDLMVAVADLNESTLAWSEPQFQTNDGARDWMVAAAVDPVSERTLIMDQHGAEGDADAVALAVQQMDTGLTAFDIPFGKDLSITPSDITFSNDHPQAGEEVVITATVHNLGLQSTDAGGGLSVLIRRSAA